MASRQSVTGYLATALLSVCLISACDTEPEATPSPAYEIVADEHDFMAHILNPAAAVIWGSAGFIITAEGERNLAPTSDALWHEVINAAMLIAESGNLLMLPGRSRGSGWDAYAGGLIRTGKVAVDAAQRQDAAALFDAGGRIYQVCRACHNQYWVKGEGGE